MKYTMDVRVNVKSVFSNMIHSDWWEGPRHIGPRGEETPEYEKRAGKERLKIWYEELKGNLDLTRCSMMEPTYLESGKDFVVKGAEFKRLVPENHLVDLYLITYRIPGIERLKESISMIDLGPAPLDVASYYRQIGLSAYMAHDYEEYNRLLTYLQVRRAVTNAKILVLSNTEQIPASINTGYWDLTGLYKRYGIRNNRIDFRQVFNYFERVTISGDIYRGARLLLEQADKADTTEEYLCNDPRYSHTVRDMIKELGYNAFTIPYRELCASRFLQQHKFVPCMTHSFNKDDRIPSTCEEDLAVWMAIMMMMYLTRQSVHIGSPVFIPAETNDPRHPGMQKLLPELGRTFDHDVLEIHHAVPVRKMRGYDQPGQNYELGHFTTQSWGTHYQVNMAGKDGQTMTMGHFNRGGTEMVVAAGHILGCEFRPVHCSPAVFYDVEDGAREFRHALVKSGYDRHQAITYNNHVKELQELGEIAEFEVEVSRQIVDRVN